MAEDRRSSLWFGTYHDTVWTSKSRHSRAYRRNPANSRRLVSDNMMILLVACNGALWAGIIGATNGDCSPISKVNTGVFEAFPFRRGSTPLSALAGG
jgi:hypothetical protein